jgi:membrane associated rhomboid family serine protease
MDGNSFYRKKLVLSLAIPVLLIIFLWVIKISEHIFNADFSEFGIYPLTIKGLPGIILSPLIHNDFRHLFNNTIPLFLLSSFLFYFYSEVAVKVLSLIWLITGVLVWIFGRDAWHIGASGLVYGLASFLFFSGIIRKHLGLISLSLLVVFLYGSMVWGMVPLLYSNVSWESHMLGAVAGVSLSILFRNEGPQKPDNSWMDEEESVNEQDNDESKFAGGAIQGN